MAIRVQNHIHLALTVGGAPEYSPVYTWKTTARIERPSVFASPTRTLTGKLRPNVFSLNGSVTLFQDRRYTIALSEISNEDAFYWLNIMKSMIGQFVKLVDHHHPDDGETHAPYVMNMYLQSVGDIQQFDPALSRFYVDIELTDGSLT